jgi:hypothetical protein
LRPIRRGDSPERGSQEILTDDGKVFTGRFGHKDTEVYLRFADAAGDSDGSPGYGSQDELRRPIMDPWRKWIAPVLGLMHERTDHLAEAQVAGNRVLVCRFSHHSAQNHANPVDHPHQDRRRFPAPSP